MNILVTGGCGYIGSHVSMALTEAGHSVVVVDNFCNSFERVGEVLTKLSSSKIRVETADIRDVLKIRKLMRSHHVDGVIHCAGLKSVEESLEFRSEYFDINVLGTEHLLSAMRKENIGSMIFSSSATVYGVPKYLPMDENHQLSPINPYGETKVAVERMLAEHSGRGLRFGALRYFNPLGSHESGELGDYPKGNPANLGAAIINHLIHGSGPLKIFGNDYSTKDGTGERDYIHVIDLARAHLACLTYLDSGICSPSIFNLGTGVPYSVQEVIAGFERVSGRQAVIDYAPRRMGDVDRVYADASLAFRRLNWTAEFGLGSMCQSAWRFATRIDNL